MIILRSSESLENVDLFSSQKLQNMIRLRDWAKQKRRVHQRESETFRWNLQRESATRALLADDRVDFSVLTPAPQGIDRFRMYNDDDVEDWIYAHAHHQYDLGTSTLSMIGTAEGFWQYAEKRNIKDSAKRIRDALQKDGVLCSIMPRSSSWTSRLESELKRR